MLGARPGGPGVALVEFLDEEHGGYKVPEADNSITTATTLSAKLSHLLVLHDFRNAEVKHKPLSHKSSSPVNRLEFTPREKAASPC
jgi:hypothetical protein